MSGIVFMVIVGMITTVNGLLLPLGLKANGMSSGSIGAAYTIAGLLGVATAFAGRRYTRSDGSTRIQSLTTLVIGASLLLPVAATGTIVLLAMVVLSSVLSALLVTVTYPLGTIGAHQAGLGPGAVMGLFNGSWGVAATLCPVVAGVLADAGGDRIVYLGMAALCLLAVLEVGRRGRRRVGSTREVTA
jgi:MFS family permease